MRGAKATASNPSESTQAEHTGRGEQPGSSGRDEASRVIYIGQLPHGFYEEQLKGKLLTAKFGLLWVFSGLPSSFELHRGSGLQVSLISSDLSPA